MKRGLASPKWLALLNLGIKLGGTAFATPPYKNSKVFLSEIIMP